MKRFWMAFGVLCGIVWCANVGVGQPDAQSGETEIRTALCEIENSNFAGAIARLEGILKKEPQNLYALRLLPGAMARQIKKDDKSPANLALIRKTIAAYDETAANPVFKDERESITRFIIELYDRIGDGEKISALLKRAEDAAQPARERAIFYTVLAADNYACANAISDVAPTKSTIRRNGAGVYVFRKPRNPADFQKLEKCAAAGNDLIRKALALAPESDIAWSYQASLYVQLARIAEMENRLAEQADYKKKYNAAADKFRELSRKRLDEEAKLDQQRQRESEAEAQKRLSVGAAEAERLEFSQELKSYRRARPLANAVDKLYIPSEISPISLSDETTGQQPPVQPENQQRAWKIFSPPGSNFSALLPDNAEVSSTAGSRTYAATGNGLRFLVLEITQSIVLPESQQDMGLNMLAWGMAKPMANLYLSGGGENNSFELNLARKEKFNEFPARFYNYRMISCAETKKGMMIFILSKKKNYAIDINGIDNEGDERFQKFIKSLKLD